MAEHRKRKRVEWWTHPFRLSIQELNYLELGHLGVTRWGVMLALVAGASAVGLVVYFLVALTPLRERVVPGYLAEEVRAAAERADLQADSAMKVLALQGQYLDLLRAGIAGDLSLDDVPPAEAMGEAETFAVVDSVWDATIGELATQRPAADSALRARVEAEDRFSLSRAGAVSDDLVRISFPPVVGSISEKFNASAGHFGIDFVAAEGSLVYAAEDGTVVLASYTVDGGYVICLQHRSNRISLYKHNASLLRGVGEVVRAGDGIAIIGGTGATARGAHCHFEWWVDGRPVDPEGLLP
jgi:murein DD-endopeptidase MepM/ murein hydrolase activator NlpD